MRCRKAKEYILKNRDGLLTEVEKIQLQHHLEICLECARYAQEIEECLGMLSDLPDMEVSESFEWNLKRRIAFEKTRVMRTQAGAVFGDSGWGPRFIAGMAATIVIVLAGAWFFFGDHFGGQNPAVSENTNLARQNSSTVPVDGQGIDINYTRSGYPAGIRMVSDDFMGRNPGESYSRQSPFSLESERKLEYLVKENEVLREYVEYYKRENVHLKKLLLQRSSKR
ncbi:MAG: zf-HC2 domain-containing protein [Bacteroidales bacterium]|nr:zf-HC2 domain-containing protein [Candidatus Latescibacterota bacterium]